MKLKYYCFSGLLLLLSGCVSNDYADTDARDAQVDENVKKVFGIDFDANQDWCTTSSGSVTVNNLPSSVETVQVLTNVVVDDENNTSMTVLNATNTNGASSVTLKYDLPSDNKGIYVAYVSNGKKIYAKVENGTASYSTTPSQSRRIRMPQTTDAQTPVIANTVESWAAQRDWIPGEVLYEMSDEAYEQAGVSVPNWDADYIQLFRTVIFSYLKNGREYNNLPLIKESGLYNEKVYPITTGSEPIVVSPVYKCDQATRWGNEVYNSDFYYYYFKESDLDEYVHNGGKVVDFLTNLPKYKAIPFNKYFGETEDNNIEKRKSYTLIYWGDGQPMIGTQGSYQFPNGYKIGFMVRAKTNSEGSKKQGELYGDGRLNNKINSWPNFSSSKLGTDGPRMGWVSLNGKMLLCCESGTDSDFNDIILEVEGGVEEMPFVFEFESNVFTYCFEDREIGDYDMNDVVIKATRIDDTTIEYSIVACGAQDKLYIRNINGNVINGSTELHDMFNVGQSNFVNTEMGRYREPITERIKVSKDFSFLNESTQPYLYDATTDTEIRLAKKGEDPHGIMVPIDFKYPYEKVCIKDAYKRFNEWGAKRVTSTNWYQYPEEGMVYEK